MAGLNRCGSSPCSSAVRILCSSGSNGMKMKWLLIAAVSLLLCPPTVFSKTYQPDWSSLDTRPLPSWYDDAKIGVFLHWGVYSVPSFSDPDGGWAEWFWQDWKGTKDELVVQFMEKNYPQGFTYADFAPMFKAELFDPQEWADIFEASGAKYVVLTSKHHDGFTNWPSKTSWNWNAVDTGPHRDLVGAVAEAVRSHSDLHFGLYFSLYEWFNPLYLQDKANKYSTQIYVREVSLPQLYEITNTYKPDVIWSDGDWEAGYSYWNSTEFLAWLYNESPVKDTVVVNDRWGGGTLCTHGDTFTCADKYHPGTLQPHKWENAMTIDLHSWGFRRNSNLSAYITIENLVWQLVSTVSCGGNLLMNIGPTHDGRIVPIFEERLRQVGMWLAINGEAIYKTRPWSHQNDTVNPNFWYTYRPDTGAVYGIQTQVYQSKVVIGAVKTTTSSKISLVGYDDEVMWKPSANNTIEISMPFLPLDTQLKWAWVFKFENISPTLKH